MEFQFLAKDKAYTYLDTQSATFDEELAQLVDQGWTVADVIDADGGKEAVEQYQSRYTHFAARAALVGAAMGFLGD